MTQSRSTSCGLARLAAAGRSLARVWRDRAGQDLLEYALIAGLIAVASGALMPGVAASLSTIHSKIASHASRVASF
jgi:Flp pilus assembly pilin Flp